MSTHGDATDNQGAAVTTPPDWGAWLARGRAAPEDCAALSVGLESTWRRVVTYAPAPPMTRAEYDAFMAAFDLGTRTDAPSKPAGGAEVRWSHPMLDDVTVKSRLAVLRRAIKRGEVRADGAPATLDLREFARWAARAGWDIPARMADMATEVDAFAPTAGAELGEDLFTKTELIALLTPVWPRVGSDFESDREGGARLAAKTDKRNLYSRRRALAWAKSRGRLREATTLPTFVGKTTRHKLR